MAKPGEDGAEIRPFRDADEFDAWLAEHHGEPAGVWLKLAKASSGIPSMTSDEAVDVGLCWGWISGQRRGLDDEWYLQKYVPRRPRSRWSQVNVRKVAELTAAGRMRSPGSPRSRRPRRTGAGTRRTSRRRSSPSPTTSRAALDAEPGRRGGVRRAWAAPSSTPWCSTLVDRARHRTSGGRRLERRRGEAGRQP